MTHIFDILFGTKKYEKGGAIVNQYKGKTAEKVWDEWTPEQRAHFLEDHADLIGAALGSPKNTYEQLSSKVKDVLKEHMEHGQYAKGGSVKPTAHQEAKVGIVMKEFKEGKLKMKGGKKVKKRKQAVAIALSEAGLSRKK